MPVGSRVAVARKVEVVRSMETEEGGGQGGQASRSNGQTMFPFYFYKHSRDEEPGPMGKYRHATKYAMLDTGIRHKLLHSC